MRNEISPIFFFSGCFYYIFNIFDVNNTLAICVFFLFYFYFFFKVVLQAMYVYNTQELGLSKMNSMDG